MLTLERRLMSADERIQLETAALSEQNYPLDGCFSVFISLAGGLVGGLLMTTPVLAVLDWLHRLSGEGPRVLVICGAIAGFSAGLGSLLRGRREWSKLRSLSRALFQDDLSDAFVSVMHCTITDAAELLDVEEAPGYFLDVGDDHVLFLKGQYLAQYSEETEDEQPPFPCTVFDIVKAPHSGTILDVQYLGMPLTPSRTIDPEKEDVDGIYFPQDGEILTASMPTLIDDLKRLNAAKKTTSHE